MGEPIRILLLGGTAEARALAHRLAHDARVQITLSLAGSTRRPAKAPVPVRMGGFGGVDGLAAYLKRSGIELVVDATHPFAARISEHAASACMQAGIPRLLLARPAWMPRSRDDWIEVADLESAARALAELRVRRVFLSVGRREIAAFSQLPEKWFLIRLIDPPTEALPIPDYELVLARGPFDERKERHLLAHHAIDVVVSKNSGGEATYAKIAAARRLGLPVVMVQRPRMPDSECVGTVEDALTWVGAHVAEHKRDSI